MSRSKSNNDDINNSQNEENALWSIVGYLLSGLMIWGGIGWGLDRWLGTTYEGSPKVWHCMLICAT